MSALPRPHQLELRVAVDKTKLMRLGLRMATTVVDVGRRAATPERRTSSDHHTIIPEATYSPWRTDDAFRLTFDKVSRNTLIDETRLYELWSLAGQLAKVPGDFLEVGVWRGGSAALIATRLRQSSANDRRTILCDTFTGVALAGEYDASYAGGEHADTSVATVEALFQQCGLPAPAIEVGIFPQDTASRIDSTCFSLVHIDVDVYESALLATESVWPRLSAGGVVVFDDYGFVKTQGVRQAVDELAGKLPNCLRVHNLNGHGLLIKR
jgi:O-methyltransferase